MSVGYYWRRMELRILLLRARLLGPPRVLLYDSDTNAAILRAFGATIGTRNVRLHAPLVLHGAEDGYANLANGQQPSGGAVATSMRGLHLHYRHSM